MPTQRTKDLNGKKNRVLQLLEAGFITQSEAATLVGVTRQRIHQWVQVAGIHPVTARERHLRALLKHADL